MVGWEIALLCSPDWCVHAVDAILVCHHEPVTTNAGHLPGALRPNKHSASGDPSA
jgi:hypothetical protein